MDLQPILINSMPRTGTTVFMYSILVNPGIAIVDRYPFEVRVATWLWKNFELLTKHPKSPNPNPHWSFINQNYHLFPNPYYHRCPEVKEYYDLKYPQLLSRQIVEQVNDYYRYIAAQQGKVNPLYFCEKFPGAVKSTFAQNYPLSREILILRNPLDIFLSCKLFNLKRGQKQFEENKFNSDRDYLTHITKESLKKLQEQEKAKSSCIIRYEAMIEKPEEIFRDFYEFLSLPDYSRIIELTLMRFHSHQSFKTTHSSSSDIELTQEKKAILTDDLLDYARTSLHNEFQQLGYSIY
jgi:hypothetical protein